MTRTSRGTTTAGLQAPVGDAAEGHLVVRRGLASATITAGSDATELVRGRWTGRRTPRARVHRGTVELTFPLLSLGRGSPSVDLALGRSVPWRIEVGGGAGRVSADLRSLTLQGLDVRGGMAHSRIDLPTPEETLVVRLGAVADVEVTRPAGVPVRVRVQGGSRQLTLDGQSLGAVGGPTTLADPGYDGAEHRIDLVVDAASRLTVTPRP